jgi:hypothetical protein
VTVRAGDNLRFGHRSIPVRWLASV